MIVLKKRIVVSFFFLTFFLLNSASVIFARSGCCSHHDGVCGCRCCDGSSLSATCAPYYPSCGGGYDSYYVAPKPIPTIPINTNATWKYFINKNGEVEMLFDWDRADKKSYSIVMSKIAGGDLGPNSDTSSSEYTFTNIKPGRWYVNVKEAFDGTWSKVTYWTVDIPSDVKNQAMPYPTPTPIPTKNTYKSNANTESESSGGIGTILALGLGVGAYHFFNKVKK